MNSINPGPNYVNTDAAKLLVEKWKPMLDYTSDKVRAIEDDHTRLTTAMLMENQERWCLTEAGLAQAGGVFGNNSGSHGGAVPGGSDFYAGGDARLPKVLIPMIRRTFPELITNEIVGVQPMSGPVGLAFALRYKYDNTSLGGDGTGTCFDGNTSCGPRGAANAQYTMSPSGNKEAGYQFLDTRFTGASSQGLTGGSGMASAFEMLAEDQGVAEFLQNYEITSKIPQMTIEFEKTAVEAGTRRLAAKWSVELEQDIKNMNGIDIDAEMTNAMSYEIQAEIDREMIMRMVQTTLSAGHGTGFSFWKASEADARWLGERTRDFYAKVIVEANRIAVRNRRGAANFIIATPRVCAMLEMLTEFQPMPMTSTVNTQPTGIAKVGSVGGRFTVYRDTRTEAQGPYGGSETTMGMAPRRATALEYALLGYKGSEYYDTGIVYCPYIPVMIQRTIGPNDFAPRVGLMTRYGVVDNLFGASLYYHTIIVKDLGDDFQPGAAHRYL
jgi:hypothetical protein